MNCGTPFGHSHFNHSISACLRFTQFDWIDFSDRSLRASSLRSVSLHCHSVNSTNSLNTFILFRLTSFHWGHSFNAPPFVSHSSLRLSTSIQSPSFHWSFHSSNQYNLHSVNYLRCFTSSCIHSVNLTSFGLVIITVLALLTIFF